MKLEISILDYVRKHLRSLAGDLVMPFISALGLSGSVPLRPSSIRSATA